MYYYRYFNRLASALSLFNKRVSGTEGSKKVSYFTLLSVFLF